MLNAIFYGIERVPNLSQETASECALAILTPGGYFSHFAPKEFMTAIDTALAEGLLPLSELYGGRFSDEDVVAFLRLLQTELRAGISGNSRL